MFRPHLHRYDFELAGVGLRKSCLEKLGARRVVYGDEEQWKSLPPAERAWFHLRGKSAPATGEETGAGQWEAEQEWRVAGDLDLRQFGPDDLVVFVADQASAHVVAPFSRWPVVVVPDAIP